MARAMLAAEKAKWPALFAESRSWRPAITANSGKTPQVALTRIATVL